MTTTNSLADSVRPFIDNHVIAGAVLLTASTSGAPRVETVGYANIAARTPMRADTIFWIASNSKAIASAALMLLVDEGKLTLDDVVAKHLPEFDGQMFVAEEDEEHRLLRKPARPVTVRDLISHTSGILPWFHDGRLDVGSLRERALACALTPLRFEPGTRWEYGNGGFEVAGRIVEIVSGEAFDAFMQTRLLGPLGMTDTTFWPSAEQLTRLATPYKPNSEGAGLVEAEVPFTYPLSELSGSPSPGGGLFSTAGDCLTFCRMIHGGGVFEGRRLLSEAALRAMTTTQTGNLLGAPDDENGYGLGLNTTRWDTGKPWPEGIGPVDHGGAHGTSIRIDPQRGWTEVFLIAQAGWGPGLEGGSPEQAFRKAADAALEAETGA